MKLHVRKKNISFFLLKRDDGKYEPESDKSKKGDCGIDDELALCDELPFLRWRYRNESPVDDEEEDACKET